MLHYLQEGGPPAWIVSLIGPLFCLACALFLRSPAPARLQLLEALSRVIVVTMVGGFAAGVGLSMSGMHHLPPERRADWPFFLMAGASESLGVVVLGCAFLGIGWTLAAVGLRRLTFPSR